MLSQELTNTRQYKEFIQLLRSGQVLSDPYGTQAMIILMLMEIVASLDGIQETIARHE